MRESACPIRGEKGGKIESEVETTPLRGDILCLGGDIGELG